VEKVSTNRAFGCRISSNSDTERVQIKPGVHNYFSSCLSSPTNHMASSQGSNDDSNMQQYKYHDEALGVAVEHAVPSAKKRRV
jgi:hypothetical protein